MSMKINDMANTQAQKAGNSQNSKETRPSPEAVSQEASRSSESDTVTLTQTAQRLHELEGALANEPVVNSQRVEAIKAAIQSGDYQIDPQRVADKLISFEEKL